MHEAATRAAVVTVVDRSGVGGMVHTASNDPLFELDLQRVDVARWLDIGRPGTRAVRHRWPPPDPAPVAHMGSSRRRDRCPISPCVAECREESLGNLKRPAEK